MSDFEQVTKTLRRQRAGYKSKITLVLRLLIEEENLTKIKFDRQEKEVNKWQTQIDTLNDEIEELCDEADIPEDDEKRKKDTENEVVYEYKTSNELASHKAKFVPIVNVNQPPPDAQASNVFDPEAIAKAFAEMQKGSPAPKLQCPKFSGENIVDKFEFKNFLSQFETVCASDGSNKAKLQRLRSQLTGEAFQDISHLSIADDNYDIAIQLLKDQYLDVPFISHEIMMQVAKSVPKYDPEFKNLKTYLKRTRADLNELKSPTYDVDLITDGTPASVFIGHIVFNKLPPSLKRALIIKTGNSYPTLKQIFDEHQEIINNLIRTQFKQSQNSKASNFNKTKSSGWKTNKQSLKESKKEPSTLENFSTNAYSLHCKFCNANGHSMFNCTQYKTLESRKTRCKELKFCTSCTSSKHKSNDCYGKRDSLHWECKLCKSKSHISALCPRFDDLKSNEVPESQGNICYNTGSQEQYILPIVNM